MLTHKCYYYKCIIDFSTTTGFCIIEILINTVSRNFHYISTYHTPLSIKYIYDMRKCLFWLNIDENSDFYLCFTCLIIWSNFFTEQLLTLYFSVAFFLFQINMLAELWHIGHGHIIKLPLSLYLNILLVVKSLELAIRVFLEFIPLMGQ